MSLLYQMNIDSSNRKMEFLMRYISFDEEPKWVKDQRIYERQLRAFTFKEEGMLFVDDFVNPNHQGCKFSHDLNDVLTVGQGHLDDYGYWEFPCVDCAIEHQEKHPEDGPVWPNISISSGVKGE